MKKGTKRLLGGLALAAGAVGAAGAYLKKKKTNGNQTTTSGGQAAQAFGRGPE